MPRILLVKTSSMGDVIHNLPVVTDIRRQFPDAVIDWVVEESFREIPALHPGIRKIIPVALRRWRKSLIKAATRAELFAFRSAMRAETYDVVLDTQGLVKSALITWLAHGKHCGYAWKSARETMASCFYQRRFEVDKTLHAVECNRSLAAGALGYEASSFTLDYGIMAPANSSSHLPDTPYAVLLHSTSRDDKLWPEENWIALGQLLAEAGLSCQLPWGNEVERARSGRLAMAIRNARVLPRLNLNEAASLLHHAKIVIGVDTGLAHLAAALGAHVIALYIATSPGLTGVYGGKNAINLGAAGRSPAVADVWHATSTLMVK